MDVWNKGVSISKSQINHIFERTYTGEYSRNPQSRGNGLGLAIVKRLVEMQNGNIIVTSEIEGKTVFLFSKTQLKLCKKNVRLLLKHRKI